MKPFCFWSLFMVVGTAFMFLVVSSSSSLPDKIFPDCQACLKVTLNNRKLKEEMRNYIVRAENKRDTSNVNVEDYPHFNPVPTSRATIKTGPIEHGTPLMPYIPKPKPPSPPKRGTSTP